MSTLHRPMCSCGGPLSPVYDGTVWGCAHCDRNVCRVPGCDACRLLGRVTR